MLSGHSIGTLPSEPDFQNLDSLHAHYGSTEAGQATGHEEYIGMILSFKTVTFINKCSA